MTQNTVNVPSGLHLMSDATDCNPVVLEDTNLICKLHELPSYLGMRKMIKPYIICTEGNNIKDPGSRWMV